MYLHILSFVQNPSLGQTYEQYNMQGKTFV